jgi:hypothetical protein
MDKDLHKNVVRTMNEIAFQIIEAAQTIMSNEKKEIEYSLEMEFAFIKNGEEFLLSVHTCNNETVIHRQKIEV